MQIWEQIVSVIVSNGIFAILFVGLFCYQLKDSRKREDKYQKTIEDLTSHLELIEDVKEDVEQLKNIVIEKTSRRKTNEIKRTDKEL